MEAHLTTAHVLSLARSRAREIHAWDYLHGPEGLGESWSNTITKLRRDYLHGPEGLGEALLLGGQAGDGVAEFPRCGERVGEERQYQVVLSRQKLVKYYHKATQSGAA